MKIQALYHQYFTWIRLHSKCQVLQLPCKMLSELNNTMSDVETQFIYRFIFPLSVIWYLLQIEMYLCLDFFEINIQFPQNKITTPKYIIKFHKEIFDNDSYINNDNGLVHFYIQRRFP